MVKCLDVNDQFPSFHNLVFNKAKQNKMSVKRGSRRLPSIMGNLQFKLRIIPFKRVWLDSCRPLA
jgi:hypothetical protein